MFKDDPRGEIMKIRALNNPRTTWAYLLVVGLAAGAIAMGNQASAVPPAAYPLDKYPGFGSTEDSALRDDTIALWEAFQREKIVQACTREAGFEYHPDAVFPGTALLAVADGLGVSYARDRQPESDTLAPAAQNRAAVDSMTPANKDRYYRTLLGESAADMEFADREGLLPPGRSGGFATGGCVGKADFSIPGVWDTPRKLESKIQDMQKAITGSPRVRQKYGECTKGIVGVAANTPGDIEDLAMVAGPGSAAHRALEECASTWSKEYASVGRAAAEKLKTTHRSSLEKQLLHYEGVMLRIGGDAEFKAYLQARAMEVAATLVDDHVAQ